MIAIYLKTITWLAVCIVTGIATANVLFHIVIPDISVRVGMLVGLALFVAGYAYEGGL